MKDFASLEDHILPYVEKPARYIGGEMHSVVKSHEGRTSLALVYPDIYEIGISNLGIRILYDLVNRDDRFVCERCYTPWLDMEQKLREYGFPLYSLETKKPLRDFDVVGVSFQYELLYTNFVTVMNLSGIPLLSADRTLEDPLIIAGGPVSGNVEPIADFVDAVCVGDGESAILEMLEVVHAGEYATKEELLRRLAGILGVYVPSLYTLRTWNGFVIPEGPKVFLRTEPDLEHIPFVTQQIIPNCEAVQDRAVVEVARGCTRGCRFCQAGIQYRPVRERSVATVVDLARKAVASTGYREFSLISLSISDYSQLGSLITVLHEQFSPHGISFSLPSLRLDSFTIDLAQRVQEIRKSGLTFAVEGATDDIRRAINKTVTEENLFEVVAIARQLGWKSVKLYFMIGLPYTSPEDEIEGIRLLLERISRQFPGITITASVAVFIPKPHTPFQWSKQMDPQKALSLFDELSRSFRRNHRVQIRYNHPHLSFLEGVFSRGDRQLGKAIFLAWQRGARFDGWNDRVDVNLWQQCFDELGIDPWRYLTEKGETDPLPWQMIQTVEEDFLRRENQKAREKVFSLDCRSVCRNQCGVCDFVYVRPKEAVATEALVERDFLHNIRLDAQPKAVLRFVFEKKRAMRYVSPTDLEEMFSRAVIQANLPVCFTQGFNPHFRFAFLWALPLGFESEMEVVEVPVWQTLPPEEWLQGLNDHLPEGLRVKSARLLSVGKKSLSQVAKTHYCRVEFTAPSDSRYYSVEDIPPDAIFVRKTKSGEKSLVVREFLRSVGVEKGNFSVSFLLTDGGLRVQDAVEVVTGRGMPAMLALHPTIVQRWVEKNQEMISLFDLEE